MKFLHSIAIWCLAVLWCGLCIAVHPGKPFTGFLGCVGVYCARGNIASVSKSVLVALYYMGKVGPPILTE